MPCYTPAGFPFTKWGHYPAIISNLSVNRLDFMTMQKESPSKILIEKAPLTATPKTPSLNAKALLACMTRPIEFYRDSMIAFPPNISVNLSGPAFLDIFSKLCHYDHFDSKAKQSACIRF
ncbi:hypothetical protein GOODEAATRI_014380 [Goodea atripinnis]|uniref:Uncharacterized protein n=1 Tax=Goodea atripinnis TaxID=208336 RepID=A0ABV0P443_9TELE